MKIQQKSNGGVHKRYVAYFENEQDLQLSNDDLYNAVESYNFGGFIYHRNEQFADFVVYID